MIPPDIIDQLETARKALKFRIFHPSNQVSISKRQESSGIDPKAKGPIWVSRVVLPPPEEDDVRQALFQAIDNLSRPKGATSTFPRPYSAAVEAEWVGHRRNVGPHAPEPAISEREKHDCLMDEISSELVLLYVHGGAFYSGSPAQSRPLISKLVKLTHGRCLSIKYRLAPQHPFPSALLDLLHAYLNLLYPSAGPSTYHASIPARTIVLTGDSVGANLCLGLIQSFLALARHQSRSPPIVRWNGVDVAMHLPRGVALISPWIDTTYSLPSYELNQGTDYIPSSSIAWSPDFPHCDAWPADPPREDIYCDASYLVHPMVNPAAAEDWRGGPPMLMLCGEEAASDGAKLVTQRAHGHGVKARWRQFERLPHVFMLLNGELQHSRLAIAEWVGFCVEVVGDEGNFVGGGELIRVRDLSRRALDVGELTDLRWEEALVLMTKSSEERRVIRRRDGAKAKM